MAVRRRAFGKPVVVSTFDCRSPAGTTRRVHLRLGHPYEVAAGEWACPVELRGFEPRDEDMRGGNALQALCLALAFVRFRLEDFIAKGGVITDCDDGTPWNQRDLRVMFGQQVVLRNA